MTANRQSWRVFCPSLDRNAKQITLEEDEHHYVHHVLRLQEGSHLEIGNCSGLVGLGTISSTGKKTTAICIDQVKEFPPPRPFIHLIVGMPKPGTLDEVVGLCAEVGANKLSLVPTERTHFRSPPRLERLEKVARETLRITKSAWQMQIVFQKHLEPELQNTPSNSVSFLCDESPIYETGISCHNHLAAQSERIKMASEVRLFIGPEASFSDSERDAIRASGAHAVSLGNNVLRVPTAAAVAAAIVAAMSGVE